MADMKISAVQIKTEKRRASLAFSCKEALLRVQHRVAYCASASRFAGAQTESLSGERFSPGV